MTDKPPKQCQSCWKKPSIKRIGNQWYCQTCKTNRDNAMKAIKEKQNGQATQGE